MEFVSVHVKSPGLEHCHDLLDAAVAWLGTLLIEYTWKFIFSLLLSTLEA